ncbi:hypothetical protein Naga_102134g1 [Nannochloropsis gaditana]|uniref:Domain of unknown function at the cortex 1 domain-containing protein n=1 Tax=Nannochloropsis gaditana TaxID=72520 RepID=W7TML3_9STRA|nr:hypothetical protein Naga_102134g1 [Nannochloropsis gaditana]
MELGLLAKGFAQTILAFVRAINPDMKHSFGDDNNTTLPHITVPLFHAAESFIITPAGAAPPPLGINFVTSETDKARRAGKIPLPRFDTTSTISFSFHSMFLDFQTWRLVSFPFIRSLDLHLMWARSAVR